MESIFENFRDHAICFDLRSHVQFYGSDDENKRDLLSEEIEKRQNEQYEYNF